MSVPRGHVCGGDDLCGHPVALSTAGAPRPQHEDFSRLDFQGTFSWHRKVFQRPPFELKPWRKTGGLLRRSRVKKGLAQRDGTAGTKPCEEGPCAGQAPRIGSGGPRPHPPLPLATGKRRRFSGFCSLWTASSWFQNPFSEVFDFLDTRRTDGRTDARFFRMPKRGSSARQTTRKPRLTFQSLDRCLKHTPHVNDHHPSSGYAL